MIPLARLEITLVSALSTESQKLINCLDAQSWVIYDDRILERPLQALTIRPDSMNSRRHRHNKSSCKRLYFSAMATLRTSRGESLSRKTCRRWHWTQEEDDLLTSLVQMHGPGKWNQIATHIPGRSGKSCRIRWLNQLHPGVDKKPFSVEEKQRLLVLHRQLGNKWAFIVHYFPGRTDNQVKNQYHILAGTRKSAPFPPRNDPHVPLDNESRGLFQNPSISMVGSHFSGVTSLGTNYHGSAPMVGVMPGLISSSSSVYGMGGYLTQVGTAIPSSLGPRPSYGNSMTSDANSASVGGYEFMDFFRVGLGGSD